MRKREVAVAIKKRGPRLLLGAALCMLVSAGTAEAATVTVGSPMTASFTSNPFNAVGTAFNSSLSEPGANVTSPISGTIVRWRITLAVGTFKLRVLTPDGGSTYTGAGSSAPVTPSSPATQTFATSLPIRAGQTVGIDNSSSSDMIGFDSSTGSFLFWSPPLPDGSSQPAAGGSSGEIAFNADVQPFPAVSSVSPSRGFTLGGKTVTITGQNFDGTTAVSFGGTPASSFTVVSDHVVTAVAPAHAAGTVDVVVRNPGQSPTVAGDHFKYVAPCVVPKLKGKSLKAARKALKHAHCRLGKVKGPKSKHARIKKQKPKRGKVLAPGSKVRVTTKLPHH